MANSDHKAGRRPFSLPDGSQAASAPAQGLPSSAPADIPECDPVAVSRWLMYLHDRFQNLDWAVISWSTRDPRGAQAVTDEVRRILEEAVVCLGQISHRRMQPPTADA
jgi:hypothetical protein